MTARRRALHCGAALLLGASAAPAFGQTSEETIVAELLVTAQSLEETLPLELSRYGHDLEIVGEEDIKARGFVDVSQALQMQVPGVWLAPRGGPFSYVDISIQGSRTGDVLWLVDGVRINNRLYTTTSPADTLPASMIERIEVLKGGESLFYGTQAAAGVINVITRGFSDEFGGEVRLGGDSNRGVHASAYARGAVGAHKLVGWLSKDEAEGFETFDVFQPSATARRRGYDVVSFGLKYGFEFTDDLTASAQYQHVDGHLDYPNPRLTHLSFNDRDVDILSARLDYTPDGPAQFFLKGYYHWWDSVYTTVENDLFVPGQRNIIDDNTFWGFEDYGVNAVAKLTPHAGVEYHLGYDFQTYSGQDDVLLIARQEETVHAVFAHVRTTPELIENTRLAAGVRHNETGETSATVWNVSGRYDLSDLIFLEGSAGTSFILPSAEQLFAIDPCCAVGNPDLEPEESLNLNLSLGGQSGDFGWRVTGFWRRIDNLILDDFSDPAFPEGIYVNTDGRVRMSGFEAQLSAGLAEALRLDASYTYTRAREAGSDLQFARIPQQLAKAALVYAPEDRPFGVSLSAAWTGEVYSTVAGFGRLNYGDHLVVDLAGHVFLDGQTRRHRLSARVENLFDETYATRIGSALVDRSAERFLFSFLGVPRTLHVAYSFSF